MVFKCKLCGKDMAVENGAIAVACEKCGMKQALPVTADEDLVKLFNNANKARLQKDFTKAEGIYKKILAKDDSLADAYWGLVLCEYGVEYINDEESKKSAVCHNLVLENITKNKKFLKALECADETQQKLYKNVAKILQQLQKNNAEIIKNANPSDVVICCLEEDKKGNKTDDCKYADIISEKLEKTGVNIFFKSKDLDGKPAQVYAAYTAAALSSAKALIIVGVDPKNFKDVSVKTIWQNYLNQIAEDSSKKIIICYKEFDSSELPKELSKFSSFDIGEKGFLRGVLAEINGEAPVEAEVVPQPVEAAPQQNSAEAPLIKRGFMMLAEGNFVGANMQSEKVLDMNPENPNAYLIKLMCEFGIRQMCDFAYCQQPFYNSINYQRVMAFGDDNLKKELFSYVKRMNENQTESYYIQLVNAMNASTQKEQLLALSQSFTQLGDYKDSQVLATKCIEKADNLVKEAAKGFVRAAQVSIEAKKWEEATMHLDNATIIYPDDYEIYLYRLMIENKFTSIKPFKKKLTAIYDSSDYYEKYSELCKDGEKIEIEKSRFTKEKKYKGLKRSTIFVHLLALIIFVASIFYTAWDNGLIGEYTSKIILPLAIVTYIGSLASVVFARERFKALFLQIAAPAVLALTVLSVFVFYQCETTWGMNYLTSRTEALYEEGNYQDAFALCFDEYDRYQYGNTVLYQMRLVPQEVESEAYRNVIKYLNASCQDFVDKKDYEGLAKFFVNEVPERFAVNMIEEAKFTVPESDYVTYVRALNNYFTPKWVESYVSDCEHDYREYFSNSGYYDPEFCVYLTLHYNLIHKLPEGAVSSVVIDKIYETKGNFEQLSNLFMYENVRKMLLSDNNITEFMLGKWESYDDYYIKFYYNDDGGISTYYNLPDPDDEHSYYDIQDCKMIYTDSNSEWVCDVYKFTFISKDKVKCYCYENGRTYTLYRE